MLVLPTCAEEESMEITRLPYSEGLLLSGLPLYTTFKGWTPGVEEVQAGAAGEN